MPRAAATTTDAVITPPWSLTFFKYSCNCLSLYSPSKKGRPRLFGGGDKLLFHLTNLLFLSALNALSMLLLSIAPMTGWSLSIVSAKIKHWQLFCRAEKHTCQFVHEFLEYTYVWGRKCFTIALSNITACYLLCIWAPFLLHCRGESFSHFTVCRETIAAEGILSHNDPFGLGSPSFCLK